MAREKYLSTVVDTGTMFDEYITEMESFGDVVYGAKKQDFTTIATDFEVASNSLYYLPDGNYMVSNLVVKIGESTEEEPVTFKYPVISSLDNSVLVIISTDKTTDTTKYITIMSSLSVNEKYTSIATSADNMKFTYIEDLNENIVGVGSFSARHETIVKYGNLAPTTSQWISIAYGNNIYVAVSDSGTNRNAYSSDGINWTEDNNLDTSVNWGCVTYGGGKFVAIAHYGDVRCAYSTDGINWITTESLDSSSQWRSVTYGDGKYVAVANSGTNRNAYSTDGITWTNDTNLSPSVQWHGVTYGNGMYVAVAITGTTKSAYSTDGINWITTANLNIVSQWRSVTYGNGMFVAIANNGSDRNAYSTDGINWISGSSINSSSSWYNVSYGDGKFSAVAYDGDYRNAHSDDGINWINNDTLDINSQWFGIEYSNAGFVAVAISGDNRVGTLNYSYDSQSVSLTEPSDESVVIKPDILIEISDNKSTDTFFASDGNININSGWYGVTFGNDKYVAIAGFGDVRSAYSTDGITWTDSENTISAESQWQSITYGANKFIAVASSGTSRNAYSTDGINWTNYNTLENTSGWYTVAYLHDKFIALAMSGDDRGATSADGITWTNISNIDNDSVWRGVTYGNGKYVAVASSGTNRNAYSDDGVSWTNDNNLDPTCGWNAVTFANGMFVAVADGGSNVSAYSTDGINWTVGDTLPIESQWYSVTYGNGVYMAVALNGTIKSAYSVDGITWIINNILDTSGSWRSITFNTDKFVAVGSGSGDIKSTTIESSPIFNIFFKDQDTEEYIQIDSVIYMPEALYDMNGVKKDPFVMIDELTSEYSSKLSEFRTHKDLLARPHVNQELRDEFDSALTTAEIDDQFVVDGATFDELVQLAEDNITVNIESTQSSSDTATTKFNNDYPLHLNEHFTEEEDTYIKNAATGNHTHIEDGNVTISVSNIVGEIPSQYDGQEQALIDEINAEYEDEFANESVMFHAAEKPIEVANLSAMYNLSSNQIHVGVLVFVRETGSWYMRVDESSDTKALMVDSTGNTRPYVFYSAAKIPASGFNVDRDLSPSDWGITNALTTEAYNEALVEVQSVDDYLLPFTTLDKIIGKRLKIVVQKTVNSVGGGTSKYPMITNSSQFNLIIQIDDDVYVLDQSNVSGTNKATKFGTSYIKDTTDIIKDYPDIEYINDVDNPEWNTHGIGRIIIIDKIGEEIDGLIKSIDISESYTINTQNISLRLKMHILPMFVDGRYTYNDVNGIYIGIESSASDGEYMNSLISGYNTDITTSKIDSIYESIETMGHDAGYELITDVSKSVSKFFAISDEIFISEDFKFSKDGINWKPIVHRSTGEDIVYTDNKINAVYSGINRENVSERLYLLRANDNLYLTMNKMGYATKTTYDLIDDNDIVISEKYNIPIAWYNKETSNLSGLHLSTHDEDIGIGVYMPSDSSDKIDADKLIGDFITDIKVNGLYRNPGEIKEIKVQNLNTLDISSTWWGIAYGNGKYVAVGSTGTNINAYSTDGINWTENNTLDIGSDWREVTYGNNLYVAVGSTGTNINAYSTDGINWTNSNTLDNSSGWYGVTYGNNLYVAVGSNGNTNRNAYSTDGINWTENNTLDTSSGWYSVTYGNGKYVAVATNGTIYKNAYSTDGINWTENNTLDISSAWYGVTYGNNLYVAVATTGTYRNAYSTDGINWTNSNTLDTSNGWISVTYGNGKYVAVAFNGTTYRNAYSTDGINWTENSTLDNSSGWREVTYGNNLYVAVGSTGTNRNAVIEIIDSMPTINSLSIPTLSSYTVAPQPYMIDGVYKESVTSDEVEFDKAQLFIGFSDTVKFSVYPNYSYVLETTPDGPAMVKKDHVITGFQTPVNIDFSKENILKYNNTLYVYTDVVIRTGETDTVATILKTTDGYNWEEALPGLELSKDIKHGTLTINDGFLTLIAGGDGKDIYLTTII